MTSNYTIHLMLMIVSNEWSDNWETTDIEHILSKKVNDEAYKIGFKSEEEIAEYIERIGNKILLEKGLNRGLFNYDFSVKKNRYKDSKFKLSHQIAENEYWSKEQIDKRDKEIYEDLLRFIKGDY